MNIIAMICMRNWASDLVFIAQSKLSDITKRRAELSLYSANIANNFDDQMNAIRESQNYDNMMASQYQNTSSQFENKLCTVTQNIQTKNS